MTDYSINPERGEVGITLEGRIFPMLPTFEAMTAIEKRLGSLVGVGRRYAESSLTLSEIATVVTECIKAAGRDRGEKMLADVSAEKIERLIFAGGLIPAWATLDDLLRNMMSGGASAKKDEPPQPQT